MSVSESNNAWGVIYPSNDRDKTFCLKKNRLTFRHSVVEQFFIDKKRDKSISKTEKSGSNVIKGDPKLFTLKLKPSKKKSDEGNVEIVLKVRYKHGIVVDGETVFDELSITQGKCVISMQLENLRELVFEAFCDVSDDVNLRDLDVTYRFISILGKGGYGYVYEGYSIDRREFCAIKVDKEEDPRKLLMLEYDFIKSFNHRNIIRAVDYIEKNTHYYLITELMDGGNLHGRMRETVMDETMTKYIYRQIGSALNYLHQRHILHRDIKPGNIVLSSPSKWPTAKLIDFGFCCYSTEQNEMRRTVGTASYMAPEMLRRTTDRNAPRYTKKIDVWSYGVSLFFTLTSQKPYAYDGDASVYRDRIMNQELNTNIKEYRSLSRGAKDVLKRCMEVDDSKRATMEEVVADDWMKPD